MSESWVVLTSCFFPTKAPIRMLEISALLMNALPLRTYGNGELYPNWTQMKVHMMIPVLEELKAEGFTHYLYTDGRDAFFTQSFNCIKNEYEALGSPDGLLSAQPDPFPIHSLGHHWDHLLPNRYRFHCCGGYMGSIDWWLETHKHFVRDDYESRPTGGDEAGVWQWAWVDGWFRPMIDMKCRIFQNLGGSEDDVSIESGIFDDKKFNYIYNNHTDSTPAILHFTGYCKDAQYGVYDAMLPWWNAIYPEYPMTKEDIKA